jgi:hypothetical protein
MTKIRSLEIEAVVTGNRRPVGQYMVKFTVSLLRETQLKSQIVPFRTSAMVALVDVAGEDGNLVMIHANIPAVVAATVMHVLVLSTTRNLKAMVINSRLRIAE